MRNGGLAIDIGRLNGVKPHKDSISTQILQQAMDSVGNIRGNYGPYFKHTNLSPSSVGGHNTWIHVDFSPQ